MGSDIIVGLDIGTSKVCSIAAEVNAKGVSLLGVGTSPSAGIRKGTIVNIDAAVDSIKKAVRDAESFSGTKIKSVYVGITGAHIKGFNSSGAVGVRGKEIKAADVVRAIDSAKTVYIPLDREVLHVIPAEFVVDGQEGIVNPVGMSGVRLEANVHIITGAASSMQNLLKCCEKAGLEVVDIVLKPLASAYSTLTEDEKEFGAVLIDIGAGTTDIALFRDGYLKQISLLGIGGSHITNDIAIGLRVNMNEAERLKKTSGASFAASTDNSEEIHINQPGGEDRIMPKKYLTEIIQPRCEEMLELIKGELKASLAYELATCGVVLTGGTARLNGFDRMAESLLGLPVRIGMPSNTYGMGSVVGSPVYSTGVGLVAYAAESDLNRRSSPEILGEVFGRMKEGIKGAFRYIYFLNLNSRKEGGILCLKSRK
ncbi:MAG: cell division protein FtsA [Nitrospirota bacterium]